MKAEHQIAESEYRAAALEFIRVVDSAPQYSCEVFLLRVGASLAKLYSKALRLPCVEPDTSGIDETPFPSEKFGQLLKQLIEKLRPLDSYWAVFDVTEQSSPIQGSLAGDISEIYFDLKDDLQLDQRGLSVSDRLWEEYSSFRDHWGRHALNAMTAIHHRALFEPS